MSNNLKRTQNGFTIVELLIVVIIIAILAAITIVSYNGITSRANDSAAKTAAESVQKKAELYATDGPTGLYPVTYTSLTTAASNAPYYLADVNFTANPATNPISSNGKNTVKFVTCGTGSSATAPANIASIVTPTGNTISYFNYTSGNGVLTLNAGRVSGVFESKNISCPTS